MGRFLAFLVFVIVVIAVCWGLTLVAQHIASRHRQKLAARFAPEMLRYENLPTDVVEAFIQQRKQLHGAEAIMFKLVNDPYFTLNTEYYTAINRWLDRQKEITK
jgi:hypothetical protein